MDFLKGAKDSARNPLGIIALFISLIYGFASLLLNASVDKLTGPERWPLILFIVIFPIMVLITFYKLVTHHHGKLYAPGDYKDDNSFLRTLSYEEKEEKIDQEVKESLGEQIESRATDKDVERKYSPVEQKQRDERKKEYRAFREELKDIERIIIDEISLELKLEAKLGVGIDGVSANFDAFLEGDSDKFTFLEVKALRGINSSMAGLDRLLYQAMSADRFFNSKFKLIVAAVYYFEDEELNRVEKYWRRRIEECPVDIEIRFIPKNRVINA